MKERGFTLVEMLVVVAIMAVAAIILVQTFSGILRGNSKSQVLGSIKQNGQSAIDTMDKVIRNAGALVCPLSSGDTLVVQNSDGSFTRYKFIAPAPPTNPTANGYILQDKTLAGSTVPNCTEAPATYQILTDTDKKTGVSITNGLFSINKEGSSSIITVEFTGEPGLDFQAAFGSQIDSVKFKTSVTIRLYNL